MECIPPHTASHSEWQKFLKHSNSICCFLFFHLQEKYNTLGEYKQYYPLVAFSTWKNILACTSLYVFPNLYFILQTILMFISRMCLGKIQLFSSCILWFFSPKQYNWKCRVRHGMEVGTDKISPLLCNDLESHDLALCLYFLVMKIRIKYWEFSNATAFDWNVLQICLCAGFLFAHFFSLSSFFFFFLLFLLQGIFHALTQEYPLLQNSCCQASNKSMTRGCSRGGKC